MKARKRNSNDEWQEVEFVQLKDSYVITKADQMEFDTPSNNTITEDEHWQDVRERAAIAAMQGTMTILSSSDRGLFREVVVEGFRGDKHTYPNEIAQFAVACAASLIEELKKYQANV